MLRLTIALLVLLAAGPALAQAHPESSLPIRSDCGVRFAGSAQPLAYDRDEALPEVRRRALSAGIFGALRDPTGARTWPDPQIEAAPPCPIARFEAEGQTWTISAGSGDAPPRWIRTDGQTDYFFLAAGPSPEGTKPAHYLIAASEGLRFVLKVYEGAPDTRMLADDLVPVITGRAGPLAVFDHEGEAVTLFLPTESGHTAELHRPAEIFGKRSATLFGTDGRFFTRRADDAIVLSGSNLPCAPAYGRFVRERLMVLDTRDGSLDLACRLSADESWITVFASRVPDASQDRAIFAARLKDAQSEGVSRRLKDVPTGPNRPVQAGRRWVDRDGRGQGVWFMRRGDYVVELRATFALSDEQAVLDVLTPISLGKLPDARIRGDGPA